MPWIIDWNCCWFHVCPQCRVPLWIVNNSLGNFSSKESITSIIRDLLILESFVHLDTTHNRTLQNLFRKKFKWLSRYFGVNAVPYIGKAISNLLLKYKIHFDLRCFWPYPSQTVTVVDNSKQYAIGHVLPIRAQHWSESSPRVPLNTTSLPVGTIAIESPRRNFPTTFLPLKFAGLLILQEPTHLVQDLVEL